jgi:adenylyltransferase/sulfurtransferase
VKEKSVKELKAMMDSGEDFVLIDVREPDEYEICNLGGKLIPLGEIPSRHAEIPKDKLVVMQCRSGGRSGQAVQWLEGNFGYENLYNLAGGILAWSDEIDPSVTKY